MSSTITVSGKVGPGNTINSLVYSNVTSFSVDITTGLLSMVSGGIVKEADISAATTCTVTISSGVYTIVVS